MSDLTAIAALRQIASVRGGFAFRTAVPEVVNGGTRAVQLRDFDQGQGPDWTTVIETELPENLKGHELKAGNILIANRGARFFAALLTDVPPRTVASGQFMVLEVMDVEVLDPAFLAWQLNQAPAQAWFESNARGAVMKGLTRAVIERVNIAVPPLAFQKNVARLVELARRERAALEALIRIREAQLKNVATILHAATEAKAPE